MHILVYYKRFFSFFFEYFWTWQDFELRCKVLWLYNIVYVRGVDTMATGMDIPTPSDEASPSIVNPVSHLPNIRDNG